MRRYFIILFLLVFFTAGCASENSTQPSQLPPDPTGYTVSEDLYGHDQSVRLESLFDADDILTETSETAFYKNGNPSISVVMQYNAAGAVTTYQEKQYAEDGSITSSLVKSFDSDGALIKQVSVAYRSDGNPRSVERHDFSSDGTLLAHKYHVYFADGTISEKKTEYLNIHTGLRLISQETYHENSQPDIFCYGRFHGETYTLLDGKQARYSDSGALLELEEATWDETARTCRSNRTCYAEDGTVISSEVAIRCYSASGIMVASESTVQENNGSLFRHFQELCVFDKAGHMTQMDVQHFLPGGFPGERFTHRYDYDAAGKLCREETTHFLISGLRQNLTVTEYTYAANGQLMSQTQTGFNDSDVQQFQLIHQYDEYGKLTDFITYSSTGNCHAYSYAYDDEGRCKSELLTTTYRYGVRIDYQETSYEYHENGSYKSVAVHKWTSYDEINYPNANPADLGRTTVTEYDEEGNKIIK